MVSAIQEERQFYNFSTIKLEETQIFQLKAINTYEYDTYRTY